MCWYISSSGSVIIIRVTELDAADEEGRTPLHVACWQGHTEVVQVLLSHGALTDAQDNENRTPLQSAAWQGHDRITELLCQHGANVSHVCDQGKWVIILGWSCPLQPLIGSRSDASVYCHPGRVCRRCVRPV